jgi:hypothetical protein
VGTLNLVSLDPEIRPVAQSAALRAYTRSMAASIEQDPRRTVHTSIHYEAAALRHAVDAAFEAARDFVERRERARPDRANGVPIVREVVDGGCPPWRFGGRLQQRHEYGEDDRSASAWAVRPD